jgi:hypothetical protein
MLGIDYSFKPHPSPLAIRAAGVRFVARYISPDPDNDANGKNLLPSELRGLRAEDLDVAVVAESGAGRMKAGHSAGAADARHAEAVTKALGMTGAVIYFACDFDATPADQPGINAYLDGAASVIGLARTGIYGGFWPVSRARAAGKAAWFWGAVAWSGDNWTGVHWHHIMQGLGIRIGGISVDVDHSMARDFGQWPRPGPAPPVTGPVRHVSAGVSSLAAEARRRHTTVAHLVGVSVLHLSPAGLARLARYLAWPGRNGKMPAGLVYWTSR